MTTRASLREQIVNILGLETDDEGQPDCLITYDASGRPIEGASYTEEVDQIMTLLDHELRTLDNINMCARAEAPVEYIDPVSGKKLYNQAYLDQEIAAAESRAESYRKMLIGLADEMESSDMFPATARSIRDFIESIQSEKAQ